jgi:peptidyl-prolyl cis-trans isomerase B (cyclophilin B)
VKRATRALGLWWLLLGVVGCGDGNSKTSTAAAAFPWPDGPHPIAVLQVEGRGEIHVELYPELAPSTVDNFVKLSNEGFYAGTTFHRILRDMMIQGGDPDTRDDEPRNDGTGTAGYQIADEFSEAPHIRGVISMANTGGTATGSSQFFILHGDARHLDGKHAIFGRVVTGMAIVDAIAAVELDDYGRWGPPNRPIRDVVVSEISIREAREEPTRP